MLFYEMLVILCILNAFVYLFVHSAALRYTRPAGTFLGQFFIPPVRSSFFGVWCACVAVWFLVCGCVVASVWPCGWQCVVVWLCGCQCVAVWLPHTFPHTPHTPPYTSPHTSPHTPHTSPHRSQLTAATVQQKACLMRQIATKPLEKFCF